MQIKYCLLTFGMQLISLFGYGIASKNLFCPDQVNESTYSFISDSTAKDFAYTKKFLIWYTPSHVQEINGIALNFGLTHGNGHDSLLVRGLHLQVNPFATFLTIYSVLTPFLDGNHPDSIAYYQNEIRQNWTTKIHGVSIGIITLDTRISGLNITGGVTQAEELHGISISGISNFSYLLNGVSIALRNRATQAKGLQIGIYNKATSLRGIQIGLWNVNGKRKLPLINWQFRD